MFKLDQVTGKLKPTDPIDLAHQEEDRNFRIYSKPYIYAILQNIMKKNSLVTVYLDQDSNSILTSILAIDSENNEMVVDYGIDEKFNQSALHAKSLIFITSLNRIKVEFVCDSIKKAHFDGNDAFVVNLPNSLVRVQRRNFFRVVTPIVNPLKCVIPSHINDGSDPAEVTLLDISCGGIAVIDQHPSISFDIDAIFEKCQILLPSVGTIIVSIQVKNTNKITLRNGLACKRAGCEFIKLQTKMYAMLQRYITKLEQLQRSILA